MKQREPHEPKLRKNTLLRVVTWGLGVLSLLIFIFRDRIGVPTPEACIYLGIAMMLVIMNISSGRTSREQYNKAKALKKHRDELRHDDFHDSAVFFRDEK